MIQNIHKSENTSTSLNKLFTTQPDANHCDSFFLIVVYILNKTYIMKAQNEINDMEIRQQGQIHFKRYDDILRFLVMLIIISIVLLIFR